MARKKQEKADGKGGTSKPDFVVPLFQRTGKNVEFLGTAFLINENTLLTANHVVSEKGDPNLAKSELFFLFGDSEDSKDVNVKVTKHHPAPDIAELKTIKQKCQFNSKIALHADISEEHGDELLKLKLSRKAILDFSAVIDDEEAPYEFVNESKLRRGTQYVALEMYKPALDDLSDVVANKYRQDFLLTLATRGSVFDSLKQTSKAEDDFQNVVKAFEGSSDGKDESEVVAYGLSLIGLGDCASRKCNKKNAILYYSRAIDLDLPFDLKASAYKNRAEDHFDLGNIQEAIVDFTKSQELDPNPDVLVRRGVAYGILSRHEEAISDLDSAINDPRNSNLSNTYFNTGIANRELENFDSALSNFITSWQLAKVDHKLRIDAMHQIGALLPFLKSKSKRSQSLLKKFSSGCLLYTSDAADE